LVDRYSTHIEHYVKAEQRKWTFQEYDEADGVLTFSSAPFELLITDLYNKVELEPAEAELDIWINGHLESRCCLCLKLCQILTTLLGSYSPSSRLSGWERIGT
jgi:hypothetical protein